jgi:succinate dehydrogenase (ubiquinone) iron-sulfur subunit
MSFLPRLARPLCSSAARPFSSSAARALATPVAQKPVLNKEFKIYRWNPDEPAKKPTLQSYTIDLNQTGPMVCVTSLSPIRSSYFRVFRFSTPSSK